MTDQHTIPARTEKVYQVVNGTTYAENTPQGVISALEAARHDKRRIRIFYGDVVTGQSWLDRYDIEGTVGRSTGTNKVPLLIHNSRSMGGGVISTDVVLRIQTTGKNGHLLYQAPNFFVPRLEIREGISTNPKYPFSVVRVTDGQVMYSCDSREKAEREIKFLRG